MKMKEKNVKNIKILIVDDNAQIVSVLEEYARKEGYSTAAAYDGQEALEQFERESPDLILLDVMLPGIDGFAVCKKIRAASSVPIIMITARGEDYDKIMGLEIGADDYIVKPFSPAEVMARIKAVLRRAVPEKSRRVLRCRNLVISPDEFKAAIGGRAVELTHKEFDLLWILAANKGRVFSRDNLLDALWGYDYCGDSRTVDTHIKRLRAKLNRCPHEGWDIKTIWGVGYRFEENDDAG